MLYIYLVLSDRYLSDILFVVPFLQSTIIEHLQIVLNDERNNIVFQALLKHDQSLPTMTVSILKWMNPLKLHMEVQNILKGLFFFGAVFRQQGFHFIGNFSGRAVSLPPTSFGVSYNHQQQTNLFWNRWCHSSKPSEVL